MPTGTCGAGAPRTAASSWGCARATKDCTTAALPQCYCTKGANQGQPAQSGASGASGAEADHEDGQARRTTATTAFSKSLTPRTTSSMMMMRTTRTMAPRNRTKATITKRAHHILRLSSIWRIWRIGGPKGKNSPPQLHLQDQKEKICRIKIKKRFTNALYCHSHSG